MSLLTLCGPLQPESLTDGDCESSPSISSDQFILGFDGIRWESDGVLALNYGVRTLDFTCLWMPAIR
jgi:hypothetical protein